MSDTATLRRREHAPGRYHTERCRVQAHHVAWLIAYAAPWIAMTVVALAGGLDALAVPARIAAFAAMALSLVAVVVATWRGCAPRR